jgi:hypothetical protein
VGGFIFCERLGWFIELLYVTHRDRAVTSVRLHAKPMGLDPVFWDIVGLPENRAMPLSFRANGAWTCFTPEIAELVLDDAGLDAAAVAEAVMRWGDEQVSELAAGWTLDAFVDRISNHPRQVEACSWLAALTAGLILAGRFEAARHECLEARERGVVGGFRAGDQDFPGMALAWMERSVALN